MRGQLFDLETDPEEWHNLAGQAEMQEVQQRLHALILGQFDPDALAADGVASVRRREVIREALARNDTHWDFEPRFDATKQYVR